MPSTRVLSIFTTLLGNNATTDRLVQALSNLPGVDPTFVLLGAEDYRKYPAPWWARLTNPWEAEFIAHRRIATETAGRSFDLLFVNTWEYVSAFHGMARRMPAVALMDSVPATAHSQLKARGQGGWKRELIHPIHHRRFRSAAAVFDRFLPMGSDCRDALVHEYGVPSDHCQITLSPQDLELWGVRPPRGSSTTMQLIFVGNDFHRKGGEFLLRLYRTHLAPFCQLKIVSNDPALEREQLPPGVSWLRGRNRDQVRDLLHTSDLFVFPTRQDYMPQVIAEALTTGVPCIASDVGGVRDLVHTNRSGFLMPYDASLEEWAKVIGSLRDQPERLEELSRTSRAFAEQHLDRTVFEDLIRSTLADLETLRHTKSRPA